MKGKIKKIFAIFALPIVFSNHFPFLTEQTKQKEERADITKDEIYRKEENPEMSHIEYPIRADRNWFITGINSTASAVSSFFEDMFHQGK